MITLPVNSFVQKASTPESDCHEVVSPCLPVYDRADVAFEFFDDDPQNATRYYCQLIDKFTGASISIEYDLKQANLSSYRIIYMDQLPAFTFLSEGRCFKIKVFRNSDTGTGAVLFVTNCFSYSKDKCWTSKISYITDEFAAFGFRYSVWGFFPPHRFYNKVRLPFYLSKPQFPKISKSYTKSDGTIKKLSSRISKEVVGVTDYMTADWHEKLVVALEHDTVIITNDEGGFVEQTFENDGAYDVAWDDLPLHPMAPAKFKLLITPYLNVNSNCINNG